jgi:hypothetical protein
MGASRMMQECFSRGTPLAEVPPEARGISLAEWQRRMYADIWQQAAEHRKTAPPNAKLMGQKVWTPRDSYGL